MSTGLSVSAPVYEAQRALRAEIDLGAIAGNFRALRDAVGTDVEIYACLKGNAYGCGIARVGPLLASVGATRFAVGNIADALTLRRAGVEQPILLYPNILPDAAPVVARERLTITLASVAEVEAWERVAKVRVSAFVKIDMGAFRGGVMPRDAAALGTAIAASGCFDIVGAYGHLHLPSPTTMADHARWQLANFQAGVEQLEVRGVQVPVRMVSGTAAVLQFPEMDLNAVDPGRMLFGIGFEGTQRRLDLRPALAGLKASLVLVKDVRKADAGDFAAPFPIARDMRIGLIPFGWSDGCPRPLPAGAVALVRGRRVPLLGPTHFEHLRVDLTDVPEATFGDEVVLIGNQGGQHLGLDEVARLWGTTTLELVGGLRAHIPRIYNDDTVVDLHARR